MRKRTILEIADTIFWYLAYSLPLILLLLHVFRTGQLVSFADVFTGSSLTIFSDSLISQTLIDLFGVGGVFPLFEDFGILYYGAYFVSVYIFHLCIDFLLFIPRFCHKCMNKFTNKE